MADILAFLAKWLSSGPLGIALGIFGLGSIGVVLAIIAKKIRSAEFGKDVSDASATAGKESKDLSDNMKNNTIAMDAAIAETQKKMYVPQMYVTRTCKANVPFCVTTVNVPVGTEILADDKWVVGYVRAVGTTQVTLVDVGTRVISIKVGDLTLRSSIVITKGDENGS